MASKSSSLPTAQPVVERKARVEPAPPVVTLAGKVAIVTGASRGIGSAVATRLARDGAKVIVNYFSSPKEADEVVRIIRASGGTAEAVKADAGSIPGVEFLFREAKRLYGRVDIIVANAGVYSTGMFDKLTESQFDQLFQLNVKGPAFLFKNAALHLEDGGRVISIGGFHHRGKAGAGVSAATKAALLTLSTSLALELAPRHITVNTVHPAFVSTDLLLAGMPESECQSLIDQTPMKRLGTVGDLADAVTMLASDSARWITGQSIGVTGGIKD